MFQQSENRTMPEYEEYNRNRMVEFDPQIPFPLRLATLIVIGSFFYYVDFGFTLKGVFG